jgi:hypothetical protein
MGSSPLMQKPMTQAASGVEVWTRSHLDTGKKKRNWYQWDRHEKVIYEEDLQGLSTKELSNLSEDIQIERQKLSLLVDDTVRELASCDETLNPAKHKELCLRRRRFLGRKLSHKFFHAKVKAAIAERIGTSNPVDSLRLKHERFQDLGERYMHLKRKKFNKYIRDTLGEGFFLAAMQRAERAAGDSLRHWAKLQPGADPDAVEHLISSYASDRENSNQ